MSSQFVQLPAGAGGGGSGTVTSVDMTVPDGFTISGNPITTNGTLQLGLSTEIANVVWAGPSSGADHIPTFRALVAADLPATALTSAHLFVGSAGNVATDVAASGDLTLANTGAFTIANNAITNVKVAAAAAIAVSKLAALTVSRAVVTDGSGFVSAATTTSTEIGYVNGVTSSIQTQLNAKQATLTLPLTVANGGTGQSTLTNHGLLVGAATAAITQLAAATTGTVLTGVTGADPAFSATPSLITAGSVTADTNFLTITNSGNAASMTDTGSSVKWNQFYYDAVTPAIKASGEIKVSTESNWTSTASTQKSYMSFSTMKAGTLTEAMRITNAGGLVLGDTGGVDVFSQTLSIGTNTRCTQIYTIACGNGSSNSGGSSIAVGDNCRSSGAYGNAFGYHSTADANFSFVSGRDQQTNHVGATALVDSNPDSLSQTTTYQADTYYGRFKGGYDWWMNTDPAGTAGPRQLLRQATVNTTNNTKTTILTFATTSNISYGFTANVTARRTGGAGGTTGDSAYFIARAGAKNIAGTVTVSSVTLTVVNRDNSNLTVTIEASSTNVIVEVTGDTNNNYTWNCDCDIHPV